MCPVIRVRVKGARTVTEADDNRENCLIHGGGKNLKLFGVWHSRGISGPCGASGCTLKPCDGSGWTLPLYDGSGCTLPPSNRSGCTLPPCGVSGCTLPPLMEVVVHFHTLMKVVVLFQPASILLVR
ncbi:hypothetical protein AVEN_111280-1 [Araneus ventricosus]|uniref:Uncharacterized protein n=1 Tax=Araneus ventricosus TaxID=182803 RepID=A0A4Y2FJW4_ARAVE|nr:hypothetical protein AVEN_111280-1 [Araneus ventricosus]